MGTLVDDENKSYPNSRHQGALWNRICNFGTGGFGVVECWENSVTREKIAIKHCREKELSEKVKERWKLEVEKMHILEHPNLVRTLPLPESLRSLFFKKTDPLPILCMEFCKKGDLRKVLNKAENCNGVSEEEALKIMKNISAAIEYLHRNNITHRDLKPENVVLQDVGPKEVVYKLIDLGFAKDLGEDSIQASIVGTLNYVAPELLFTEKYSNSVDYWSLGILFYEVATGTRPLLANLPRTKKWMEYLKNKKYENIWARVDENGEVVYGNHIEDSSDLSGCIRPKLEEWFRIVLQLDPKKRGRELDEQSGEYKLVVFQKLQNILNTKIVRVFVPALYQLIEYSLENEGMTIKELKILIEQNTKIPVDKQVLVNDDEEILNRGDATVVSQIIQRSNVIYLFTNVANLRKSELKFSPEMENLLQQARKKDFKGDHLLKLCKETIFLLKTETRLYNLYRLAISINVDIVDCRMKKLKRDLEENAGNVQLKMTEAGSVLEKMKIGDEKDEKRREKFQEVMTKKIEKLRGTEREIAKSFEALTRDNEGLQEKVRSLNWKETLSNLSDSTLEFYEFLLKSKLTSLSNKERMKPIGTINDILKFRNYISADRDLTEITKKILKLEDEIPKLQNGLSSMEALTDLYFNEITNPKDSKRESSLIHQKKGKEQEEAKGDSSNFLSGNATEVLGNRNFDCISSSFGSVEPGNDVIFDNLVIRHMMDDLIAKMQRNCLEFGNL